MTDNTSDWPTEAVPIVDPAAESPAPVGTERAGGRRTVAQQLARVLDTVGTIDPIQLTLLDAQGLLLAEEVHADAPLPGFDNAAMDGYAVRAVDLKQASPEHPLVLPVVSDVVAGARSVSGMGPGLCMRIMTGAPIPPGPTPSSRWRTPTAGWHGCPSDARCAPASACAVPVRTSPPAPSRSAREPPSAHSRSRCCRRRARPGAGTAPPPRGGHLDRLRTHRRRQATELRRGGRQNSYMLAAAARDAGADAYRVGIVPDDHARLLDVLDSQLLRADVIITTGGVSAGAFDVVKEALSQLGSVEFLQIAMQPGSPQGFGTLGRDRTPIFCLPGNPVAAMVSFEVFVRPAIRKLLGRPNVQRQLVQAISLERISSPPGRRQYRRGLLQREPDGRYSVSQVGGHGSHLIAALAASNCLIVIDEDTTEVVPGSRVTVQPLLLAQR